MQRLRLDHAYRLPLLITLCVAAVAINALPLPFFDTNQILLGNAFAIVVTILYGLRLGLLVSIVASSVGYFYWTHMLATLPFAVEILVIGWALRRQKSVLLAGLLYWLLVGWALVFGLYWWSGLYTEALLQGITLKYMLNGMFNLLLGFALFHVIRALEWEPALQFRTKIEEMLVNTGLFLTLTVASLVIYFWLRAVNTELLVQAERQIDAVGQLLKDRTQAHITRHQQALQSASLQLSEQSTSAEIQQALLANHTIYQDFLTMLATDAAGNLIATSPAELLSVSRENGVSDVRDRDYYYRVKESMQPFTSEAFRGRGFGNDPIVALSVPYFRQQAFAGVIEGSLNLSELATIGYDLELELFGYLIIDSNQRVVYSSPQFELDFLADMTDHPLLQPTLQATLVDSQGQRDLKLVDQQSVTENGWRVVTTMSLARYEQNLSNYVLGSMLLLFALAVLSIAGIRLLTHRLTRPITELVEKLQRVDAQLSVENLSSTAISRYVCELHELQHSFSDFAERLRTTLAELRSSNVRNHELNVKLQQANNLLEERVKRRTEQLEIALQSASAASQVKSQFLANISHEIRTPLHGILGMTEVLQYLPESAPVRPQLSLISESGQHLLRILNDILDLSKVESGKLDVDLEATQLRLFLKSLIENYRSRAQQKGLDLTMTVSADVPDFVNLDQTRLRQMLDNILSNAIKFTRQGSVKVQVDYVLPDQLHIHVQDTGIGIEADRLAAIFEPFEQADSSTTKTFGGTGLGLTIARHLARLMGGDLVVSSELGVGSIFSLKLRAAPTTDSPQSVIHSD